MRGAQDREPPRENARAIGGHPEKIESFDVALFDHRASQMLQSCEVDAMLRPMVGMQDALDAQDRARRTDAHAPGQPLVRARDRQEFQRRRDFGALQGFARDLALGEKALAVVDAAHVKAVGAQGLVAFSEDALGAAATDVDHQSPLGAARGEVRHAQVDQAGFLAAGNHFDGMAQCRACADQECLRILRLAQSAGADGAHAARRLFAQALAELFQAGQRALADTFLQALGLVETFRQGDAIAQAVEHDQLPVDVLRNHQVEAVGAQVDRCDSFTRGSCVVRFEVHEVSA